VDLVPRLFLFSFPAPCRSQGHIMMRDEYRWTDHVITPRRLRAEAAATLLILALIGGAGLLDGAASAGPAPSVARIAGTQSPPLHKEARRGPAASGHC
jgi:hypothetical protein